MEQLSQILKNGHMQLQEVPLPVAQENMIVVKNYFSAISIGTEGKTVSDARKGLIAKALSRKNEVKKVIQSAKTLGIVNTYKLVSNKLDTPASLGYSCAGEIIAIGLNVNNFKIGDFVACGGNTANHAAYVQVPVNLVVKVNNLNFLKEASLTTLGAIALQGVRQANLTLGECALVIGLGLIGQLSIQLLRAAGIHVIGIDIDNICVTRAIDQGFVNCFNVNDENLIKKINALTNGNGVDGVLITASTSSLQPIEIAGMAARRKANVVIVGAVPTGFERANFFKKELSLKMSCSYGPGRYDNNYEIHALDYPIEYVRWTENRNMQAFVSMLENQQIDLKNIITQEYSFDNCIQAYDDLIEKKISACAVIVNYNNWSEKKQMPKAEAALKTECCTIGLIGAGSFAQNFLLPNIVKSTAKLHTVATNSPLNAANTKSKFSFLNATCDFNLVNNSKEINTVFIATRHNTHASLVLAALNNNKNVFVEKPLCLTEDELQQIKLVYNDLNKKPKLMVGFNRRFSPLTKQLKEKIEHKLPSNIIYRINAGYVEPKHWTQDPLLGGGRLFGEVCHFIDLCFYLAQSTIKKVNAFATNNADGIKDSYTIQLQFSNESTAAIIYSSHGSKAQSKEQIDVFNGNKSFILSDFKSLTSIDGKEKTISLKNQNKGHETEIAAFIDSINNNLDCPISTTDIFHVFDVMFACDRSIKLQEQIII